MAVAACAVLPAPRSEDSTLLVVPIELDRTVTCEVYGRCQLRVVGTGGQGIDKWLEMPPSVQLVVVPALPPGSYQIPEIRFVYYDGNRVTEPVPVKNVSFEMQAGRITILQKTMQYSLQKYEGRYDYMFYWQLTTLTQTKAKSILGQLRNDRNCGLWELSDKTRKSSTIDLALAEL